VDPAFIHRFVPATAPDAPVWLLLHGTGGSEDDLIPLGKRLAPGSAFLSPRGQVMEGSAPRFFRRFAEGVLDLEDWRFRTGELADFLTAAVEKYALQGRRLTALGYSNGANIAVGLLLLRPRLLNSAVLLRPMFVDRPARPPDLSGRAVFIGSGRLDGIVPAKDPDALAGLLRSYGARVDVEWRDAGHPLNAGDLTAVSAWLERRKLEPSS